MDRQHSHTLTAPGTFGAGTFSAHTWEAALRSLRAGSGEVWGDPKPCWGCQQELRPCWVPRWWGWPSLAKFRMNHSHHWGITGREGQALTVHALSSPEVRAQRHWDLCEWLAEPARTGRSQSNDNNSSYPREPCRDLCFCRALAPRVAVLPGHWGDTWGHSRQEQERSDDISETLLALMNGYNGTQSKQFSGGQLAQRRISPFTSECSCPPLQFGCPALATTDVPKWLLTKIAGDLRSALHRAVKSRGHVLCSGGAEPSVGYIAWNLPPGPRN